MAREETKKEPGYTKSVPRKFDLVKVEELMSKPVFTVSSSSSVKQAAGIMKQKGIRGLVVADAGQTVGVVTDRDLVEKVVAANKNADKVKVSDVMTPKAKLIVARPDEDIVTVAKRLRKAGVGRVPIVTAEGKLVGIVTETDLTRAYPGMLEILYEELEEKGLPIAPDRETMAGKCDRCGNYSEFLVQYGEEWLCDECGAEGTTERAGR